jgi:uncharacterized SAM-binding protein YcdF (DUF218 family)
MDYSSPKRTRYNRSARYVYWLSPVFIVSAFAFAWMARASILRGVAGLWVVSDALDRADAIVILGGRLDVRPLAAAALYKRGFAQQILVSNVRAGPIIPLQLLPSQIELTSQILFKLGVPQQAIGEFGDGSSNTYEEARAVLDWARTSGAGSLIIPTDAF